MIVEEGGRLGNFSVGEEAFVSLGILPGTMGSLEVQHEKEGFFRIAVLQPFDGVIGQDVGGVAFEADFLAIEIAEGGIEVGTLGAGDRVVVEAM